MTGLEKILDHLKRVDKDLIWGAAIHNAIEKNDYYVTIDLIAALKSQAQDDPKVMESIIGKHALKLLLKCPL